MILLHYMLFSLPIQGLTSRSREEWISFSPPRLHFPNPYQGVLHLPYLTCLELGLAHFDPLRFSHIVLSCFEIAYLLIGDRSKLAMLFPSFLLSSSEAVLYERRQAGVYRIEKPLVRTNRNPTCRGRRKSVQTRYSNRATPRSPMHPRSNEFHERMTRSRTHHAQTRLPQSQTWDLCKKSWLTRSMDSTIYIDIYIYPLSHQRMHTTDQPGVISKLSFPLLYLSPLRSHPHPLPPSPQPPAPIPCALTNVLHRGWLT